MSDGFKSVCRVVFLALVIGFGIENSSSAESWSIANENPDPGIGAPTGADPEGKAGVWDNTKAKFKDGFDSGKNKGTEIYDKIKSKAGGGKKGDAVDSDIPLENPDPSIGAPTGYDPEGKPGILGKAKTNIKKVVEVGKGKADVVIDKTKVMADQGVRNVKDSLNSGFSSKNLLTTAGITVGVDLMTQVMRGEKPSPKKALQTIATAEFAGSVVGSVTGAAAGSFFVPFLSAIPVVGGVMSALAPTVGSIVGSGVGSYMAGDLKKGKLSVKDAVKNIDWTGVAGQTIGSVGGSMLGATMLGIVFPPLAPLGAIVGGIVGGYIGNLTAHAVAGIFGRDKPSNDPSATYTISGATDRQNGPTIRVPPELTDVSPGQGLDNNVGSAAIDPERSEASSSTVIQETTGDY